MAVSLEQVAAELYGLPLDEFVAQRNARAKELKAEDADLAGEVARLPKPVAAAHQLNLFARQHPDVLDRLLDVGAELRTAQEERDGERVRALTKEATDAVRDALRAMGAQDPVPLEQTLRAAMADEQAAAAVQAGVLVKPLAPAGFGAVDLTGAVAVEPTRRAPRAPAPRVRKDDAKAAREAEQAEPERRAAERLQQAESDLADAERVLTEASAAHQEVRDRVAAAEAALDDARAAEHTAAKREREARQARDKAARAAERLRPG